MNDLLDLILRRAEIVDHVLSAADFEFWPNDQRESVMTSGLIRRLSDATVLTCESCGTPHPADVIRDARKPARPYHFCPEAGRIVLSSRDVERWEVDLDQMAVLLRREAGLTGKAVTLVPSRIWLLGRSQTADRQSDIFLIRGHCWPDGSRMFSECLRLQQSTAALVLVPSRIPLTTQGEKLWPIRALTEVLSLTPDGIAVDKNALSGAMPFSGASSSSSRQREPRKRLSRSAGSPQSIQVVDEYLKHKNITATMFASQFGSTDRTVRSFRKSGKLRTDVFREMAAAMGLTSEELLRGDTPPDLKR